MRQFDSPRRACAAICRSRAADRPAEPGATVCHADPEASAVGVPAGSWPTGAGAVACPPLHPPASNDTSTAATTARAFVTRTSSATDAEISVRKPCGRDQKCRRLSTPPPGTSAIRAAITTQIALISDSRAGAPEGEYRDGDPGRPGARHRIRPAHPGLLTVSWQSGDLASWSGRGPGRGDETLDVLAERPVLLDRFDDPGQPFQQEPATGAGAAPRAARRAGFRPPCTPAGVAGA